MTYDWYKLLNKVEFEATGLVSRTLNVFMDGIGQADVLITRGNELGVMYDDAFLVVGLNGRNPYASEGYAVYLDQNDDVWLGIEVPE